MFLSIAQSHPCNWGICYDWFIVFQPPWSSALCFVFWPLGHLALLIRPLYWRLWLGPSFLLDSVSELGRNQMLTRRVRVQVFLGPHCPGFIEVKTLSYLPGPLFLQKVVKDENWAEIHCVELEEKASRFPLPSSHHKRMDFNPKCRHWQPRENCKSRRDMVPFEFQE